MRTRRYYGSVVLITAVLLVIGGLLWNSGTVRLNSNAAFGSTGWSRGSEDAPVTIDIFTDFLCFICVEKERMVTQAMKDYDGRIRMVYHHYAKPGLSEKIAEGLEAAGEQGKFWELHDQLVDLVPQEIEILQYHAGNAGLDMDLFNAALESGKFTETVRQSKKEAVAQGVKSVGLFINGKEYKKHPGTLEELYTAIDAELEKVKIDAD